MNSPSFYDRDQSLREQMGPRRMAEPLDENLFWQHQREIRYGAIEDPSLNVSWWKKLWNMWRAA